MTVQVECLTGTMTPNNSIKIAVWVYTECYIRDNTERNRMAIEFYSCHTSCCMKANEVLLKCRNNFKTILTF